MEVTVKRGNQERELNVLKIFDDILNNKSPILEVRMKFINILRKTADYDTPFNDNEINWMIHNIDCIPNIVNSKKAIMVIWCIYRQKETYIQEIARCCRSYTTPIKYWITLLENLWLIEKRISTFGRKKVFYHLNYKNYPIVINTFLELFKQKHTEEYLDSLVIPNRREDGTLIDKQKEALKNARRKRLY